MRYVAGMPGGPKLKVITVITDSDGTILEPSTELRFNAPLTVEKVGSRIEVSSPTVGLPYTVPQVTIQADDPFVGRTILAVALDAPVHIGRISYYSAQNADQSDTNYALMNLYEVDANGESVGSAIWTYGTNVVDFLAFTVQSYAVLDRTLPLGHVLYVDWEQHGTGQTIGGAWIIT